MHVTDFDSSAVLEAGKRPTVLLKGECKLKRLTSKGESQYLTLIIGIESPERRTREIYIPTQTLTS